MVFCKICGWKTAQEYKTSINNRLVYRAVGCNECGGRTVMVDNQAVTNCINGIIERLEARIAKLYEAEISAYRDSRINDGHTWHTRQKEVEEVIGIIRSHQLESPPYIMLCKVCGCKPSVDA